MLRLDAQYEKGEIILTVCYAPGSAVGLSAAQIVTRVFEKGLADQMLKFANSGKHAYLSVQYREESINLDWRSDKAIDTANADQNLRALLLRAVADGNLETHEAFTTALHALS
jgi:hypothetical protein